MNRWIPWQDMAVFFSIPALYTGLALWAAVTPQEWTGGKGVALVGIGLALYVVVGFLLYSRWNTKPSFETRLGTRVWANGLTIDPAEVADAMCFYAANVSRLHQRLDEATVLSLMSRAFVEFTPGSIHWGERHYNGLQRGRWVKVRWLGGFSKNAFFHELHHMVDEELLGLEPDYHHKDALWWGLVPELKQLWAEGPKKGAV